MHALRVAARLAVVDRAGALLLLPARDPTDSSIAPWWELPGGGVEPGEDTVGAALREAAEEAGVRVGRSGVAAGSWTRVTRFRYLGRQWHQREVVHAARLDGAARVPVQHSESESATFSPAQWLPLGPALRTFPAGLHRAVPRLLAGEVWVDPEEELWV